jgi:xylulokinase
MSGNEYVIGVDIGTTTTKGMLVDISGHIIAQAQCEHDVSRPLLGWAEHDAEKVWWEEFTQICKGIIQKSDISPSQISAVACSALYPDLLPVDSKGYPLRSGILYGIDTRAFHEIDELNLQLGSKYSFEVNGNCLSSQSIAPKILWIKSHEPDIFRHTAKFLTASSYINYKLSGNYSIDHNSASMGGIPYSMQEKRWDQNSCKAIGIDKDMMPELVESTAIVGTVTKAAAQQTGLAEGTPVIAGCGDFAAEMLSVGILDNRQAVLTFGTTIGFAVCSDEPVTAPSMLCARSPIQGKFVVGGGLANGASITKWYRDQFASAELECERISGVNAYDQLDEAANHIQPGCEGLICLPYFSGERSPFCDPCATGLLIGLTLRHTKAHIYRAFYEGIGYSIHHVFEEMYNVGLTMDTITAVGGGIKNRTWLQIVSDILGKDLFVITTQTGAPYGAACIAALGIGSVPTIHVINDWLDKKHEVIHYNDKNTKLYIHNYGIYRHLYSMNKAVMHELNNNDLL